MVATPTLALPVTEPAVERERLGEARATIRSATSLDVGRRRPRPRSGRANSSPPSRAADVVRRAARAASRWPTASEQLVAGVVAQGVVDHLEVVEVDEEHADDAAVGVGAARPPA